LKNYRQQSRTIGIKNTFNNYLFPPHLNSEARTIIDQIRMAYIIRCPRRSVEGTTDYMGVKFTPELLAAQVITLIDQQSVQVSSRFVSPGFPAGQFDNFKSIPYHSPAVLFLLFSFGSEPYSFVLEPAGFGILDANQKSYYLPFVSGHWTFCIPTPHSVLQLCSSLPVCLTLSAKTEPLLAEPIIPIETLISYARRSGKTKLVLLDGTEKMVGKNPDFTLDDPFQAITQPIDGLQSELLKSEGAEWDVDEEVCSFSVPRISLRTRDPGINLACAFLQSLLSSNSVKDVLQSLPLTLESWAGSVLTKTYWPKSLFNNYFDFLVNSGCYEFRYNGIPIRELSSAMEFLRDLDNRIAVLFQSLLIDKWGCEIIRIGESQIAYSVFKPRTSNRIVYNYQRGVHSYINVPIKTVKVKRLGNPTSMELGFKPVIEAKWWWLKLTAFVGPIYSSPPLPFYHQLNTPDAVVVSRNSYPSLDQQLLGENAHLYFVNTNKPNESIQTVKKLTALLQICLEQLPRFRDPANRGPDYYVNTRTILALCQKAQISKTAVYNNLGQISGLSRVELIIQIRSRILEKMGHTSVKWLAEEGPPLASSFVLKEKPSWKEDVIFTLMG